jgi:hypothetical protein
MMPGGVAVELEIEILQCRYVHAISNRVHWLFVAAGLVRSNWPLIVMIAIELVQQVPRQH